jgi:hypothetical protein
VRFQCGGLERFGQGLQAGLLDGRGDVLDNWLGGGLAHGDFEMENGADWQAVSMEGRNGAILTKRPAAGGTSNGWRIGPKRFSALKPATMTPLQEFFA